MDVAEEKRQTNERKLVNQVNDLSEENRSFLNLPPEDEGSTVLVLGNPWLKLRVCDRVKCDFDQAFKDLEKEIPKKEKEDDKSDTTFSSDKRTVPKTLERKKKESTTQREREKSTIVVGSPPHSVEETIPEEIKTTEEYDMEMSLMESEEIEESEIEEEEGETLFTSELETEDKPSQLQKDIEEILSYEFSEDPNDEPEKRVLEYEQVIKELDKQERDMDKMIEELEKNEKLIISMDKVLDPLLNYYRKTVAAFNKIEDPERLKAYEEQYMSGKEGEEEKARVEAMAREVLETEDIEDLDPGKDDVSLDDFEDFSALEEELGPIEEESEKEEEVVEKKVAPKTKAKPVKKVKARGGKGRRSKDEARKIVPASQVKKH